jgi:hypothetical protein
VATGETEEEAGEPVAGDEPDAEAEELAPPPAEDEKR